MKKPFLQIALMTFMPVVLTAQDTKMLYSVSMPQPSDHLYHVTLQCTVLEGYTVDF